MNTIIDIYNEIIRSKEKRITKKMTQQKTLQALGRIGRNQIQQSYTIRFRDDSFIYRLLEEQPCNIEADNMNKLFTSTM